MTHIDFFDSLAVPFHFWQFTCLIPFSLKNHKLKSIPRNIYKTSSFCAIGIQLLVMILCIIFMDHVVSPDLPKTIRTLDVLTLSLAQFTTLVIFWESYSKRFIQSDFLRKINSIDFILEYKIGISPDYKKRKQTNIRRLSRWLILDFAIFIPNFVILYIAFEIAYRWWTIFFVSFFIYSLRYYQITTFVDMIHYRYDQINQFINNLRPHDESHLNINVDLAKTTGNVGTIFDKYQSGSIYEKMRDVRRVCRLLSSANNNINRMFQYSIPLIIVNDFLQILINSYWVLRILIRPNAKIFYLFPPLFWTFSNFNHVISVANVCHHATEEAQNVACHIQMLDFHNRDLTLRDMIHHFSLELMRKRIFLSAFGFFEIDFTLVFTVISVSATYLTILIQITYVPK